MAREITYNSFKILLIVFMPNITTNHAITYTNLKWFEICLVIFSNSFSLSFLSGYKNITASYPRVLIKSGFSLCQHGWQGGEGKILL